MDIYMRLHKPAGGGDLCLLDLFKGGHLILGFSRHSKCALRGAMPQLYFLVFSGLNPHMYVHLLWESEYMGAALRHLLYLCTTCTFCLPNSCPLISWNDKINK